MGVTNLRSQGRQFHSAAAEHRKYLYSQPELVVTKCVDVIRCSRVNPVY